MPDIVLSAEQAQLLFEADRVRVVGPTGNLLGHIDRLGSSADADRLGWSADADRLGWSADADRLGWSAEEIAAIKRRAREGRTWYSGEQVQSHLRALDRALEVEGSIDEIRAREVLNEARAHRVMNYSVVWSQEAEDELLNIWLSAASRREVTEAQSRIDFELAHDPLRSAVHLAEGLYRLELKPLCVIFEVSGADQQVRVESVRKVN